ncbi:MAG: hydrogenase formation HypD protein [Herbinix sp.]|nr:hydrogenase formation HypD protein [Herbinix sp.]
MKTLQQVMDELKNYDGDRIKIMEVCGTHTSSIFKNGIRSLLSPKIQLISGPGCPVCVTSSVYIDRLVEYALQEKHCVLTFGDMMKVKGNQYSLTEAKANGGKVRILYSPLSALKIAMEEPDTQFIFAAVGFETTTPIYALIIEDMIKNEIKNLKLLTSIKTIIPALTFICENEEKIDAFLCPGHVSVITGSSVYIELVNKYHKPFVIAGFEGEHILAAVSEIVQQVTSHKSNMKNMYVSAVTEEGNQKAQRLVNQYFESADDYWREIGVISNSALRLRQEYKVFDAGSEFKKFTEHSPKGCKCRDVILGRIHPVDCPMFKTVCTPMNAIGPCMVSTEGACGIWYKNRG